MTIHDIDFGELYRQHVKAAGVRPKPPGAWDARAESMAEKVGDSSYVQEFCRRLDLSECTTLLDVGCGPGAIALALAPRMKTVYALDYSAKMLELLLRRAKALGVGNVVPIHRAWEEDWGDVPECDIVTASRSTAVTDMADALAKMDSKARRRAYLTNLVGGQFIDPEVARLLDRPRPAMPDFIYIVNILYQMGRLPRVDYIVSANRLAGATHGRAFAAKVQAIVGSLTAEEEQRLVAWFEADPERGARGGSPFRWAFVSWEKP